MSDPKPVMGQQLKPFDVMRSILERERDKKNGIANAITPSGESVKIVPNDYPIQYRKSRLVLFDTTVLRKDYTIHYFDFFRNDYMPNGMYKGENDGNYLESGNKPTYEEFYLNSIELKSYPKVEVSRATFEFGHGPTCDRYPLAHILDHGLFQLYPEQITVPGHHIFTSIIRFGAEGFRPDKETIFTLSIDGYAKVSF